MLSQRNQRNQFRAMVPQFTLAMLAAALVAGLVTATTALTVARQLVGLSVEAAPPLGPAGDADEIALHGDWVIQVAEPDGRIVSRTEFTNDLTPEGRTALWQLLLGESQVGTWNVAMRGPTGTRMSVISDGPGGGLAVTARGDQLVLAGSFMAVGSGRISSVESGLATCTLDELRGAITFYWASTEDTPTGYHAVPPLRPPGRLCSLVDESQELYENGYGNWAVGSRTERVFTETSVPRPVEITSGQRVSVEVVFTFSSSTRFAPLPAAAAAGVGTTTGTTPPSAPAAPRVLP